MRMGGNGNLCFYWHGWIDSGVISKVHQKQRVQVRLRSAYYKFIMDGNGLG